MAHHGLARHGEFAVAALLGGHVDDHAARLHRLHHLGGDEPRCGFAGDQCGRDDDVDLAGLLRVHRALRLLEALAHDFGVAAAACAFFLVVDLHELAAERDDLVCDFGARVVGAHDGAEVRRSADGGETCDTGAGDEDLGGRDLAGGGDLAVERPTEGVCGFDDGAVAGDARHGGEGIHLLRARQLPRQRVDGEHRGLAGRELLHQFGVLGGPDEADEGRTLAQLRGFGGGGRANLEDDIGGGVELGSRSCDRSAGGPVGVVAEVGGVPRTPLDTDLEAEFQELLDHLGDGGDALFAGEGLARHSDRQGHGDLISGRIALKV